MGGVPDGGVVLDPLEPGGVGGVVVVELDPLLGLDGVLAALLELVEDDPVEDDPLVVDPVVEVVAACATAAPPNMSPPDRAAMPMMSRALNLISCYLPFATASEPRTELVSRYVRVCGGALRGN